MTDNNLGAARAADPAESPALQLPAEFEALVDTLAATDAANALRVAIARLIQERDEWEGACGINAAECHGAWGAVDDLREALAASASREARLREMLAAAVYILEAAAAELHTPLTDGFVGRCRALLAESDGLPGRGEKDEGASAESERGSPADAVRTLALRLIEATGGDPDAAKSAVAYAWHALPSLPVPAERFRINE